jgi:hypothetical protein
VNDTIVPTIAKAVWAKFGNFSTMYVNVKPTERRTTTPTCMSKPIITGESIFVSSTHP